MIDVQSRQLQKITRASRQIKKFLWSDETLNLLDHPGLRCGWNDGGCLILAMAVKAWLTALSPNHEIKLMALKGSGWTTYHHFFVLVDGFCVDGDGICTQERLLRRWRMQELLLNNSYLIPVDEIGDRAAILSSATENSEISAKLASQLAERFPQGVFWYYQVK
jgi:hypothetical protein